jgi:hypothetical protein
VLPGRGLLKVQRGRVPELFDRPCVCGGVAPRQRKRKPGPGRPPKQPGACPVCHGTGLVPWHPLTLAWWRAVWTSEVHGQYLKVDLHGLYVAAALEDRFWKASDAGEDIRTLAAERRLQQQAFGLTPLDRSRLQWEVERPPQEGEKQTDEAPPTFDSRAVLRALK